MEYDTIIAGGKLVSDTKTTQADIALLWGMGILQQPKGLPHRRRGQVPGNARGDALGNRAKHSRALKGHSRSMVARAGLCECSLHIWIGESVR